MTTLRLITEQDFRTSRFGQLADQIDGDLSAVIAQAEAHVEHMLNRRLAEEEYTEVWSVPTWGDKVFVQQRPIVSVTSIQRRASFRNPWQSLDLTAFQVWKQQGYVRDLFGWPTGVGYVGITLGTNTPVTAAGGGVSRIGGYEVKIVYTAGYSPQTIPSDLKAAVIIQTALMIYQDLEIFGLGDSRSPGILYLQEWVDRYLKPYRKLVI